MTLSLIRISSRMTFVMLGFCLAQICGGRTPSVQLNTGSNNRIAANDLSQQVKQSKFVSGKDHFVQGNLRPAEAKNEQAATENQLAIDQAESRTSESGVTRTRFAHANSGTENKCDFSALRPVRITFFSRDAIRKRVQPDYPPDAVKRRAEGRVSVKALVNELGNIEKACATGGDESLRRSAEAAVLQWKFKPGYGIAFIRPTTRKNPKNYAEVFLVFDFKRAKRIPGSHARVNHNSTSSVKQSAMADLDRKATATMQEGAKSEITFCKFRLSDQIKQAHASFYLSYLFQLDQRGHPQAIRKVLNDYVAEEEVFACMSQWKFVGISSQDNLLMRLRWEHGEGWTELSVSGKAFSNVIKMPSDPQGGSAQLVFPPSLATTRQKRKPK